MVVIRSRYVDERVDAVRKQAEQQIQNLAASVHNLHAGVDEELRQGLREARDRIEALRSDGTRELGQHRQALVACQDELHQLWERVEALREGAVPAPSPPDPARTTDTSDPFPVTEAGQPSLSEVDVHSEPDPDAVSMQTLFTTLTKAALISTAEIRCHRHTWSFIARHVAHQPLVHELLPKPEPAQDGGLLTAHVSGPVLMGILNALHETRHARPNDRLTREHIEEKALAGALFARISANISNISGGEGPTPTRIVFDDRPTPPPDRPTPEEPEPPASDPQPKTPPPTLYRISGQILRAPHPLYCVARTTSEERCRNPLEFGQTGAWVTITTAAGLELPVYDVGHNPRWTSQHCTTHDDPTTEDYCPPQWQPYDPETGQ